MPKKILIADDEPGIRQLIAYYLRLEGYSIIEAFDGRDALRKFEHENIDLIILDVMMPYVDGLDVCSTIRQQSNVLILLLTARSEEEDKLLGYNLGADDYMTKPFSPKVLVAKVKAMLKRSEITSDETGGVIRIDSLEIDEPARDIRLDGESVSFPPKEFDILMYLVKNKNIVLSRESIINSIWGYDYDGDMRAVDTHIRRIREKLKRKAHLISTITGVGYKFEVK